MREKKQLGKTNRLLTLLLAIVLMCGMIPIESVQALENETSQDANEDGVHDGGETVTTNDNGEYLFEELTADDYVAVKPLTQTADNVNYLPPGIQTTSVAIQPESSTVYTINSTVIGFAGCEWWVIGDSGSGVVSPQADAVTLWGKNYDFGSTSFNPMAPARNINDYNNSTQQSAMNALDTSLFASGNDSESNYVINRASFDLLSDTGNNTWGYSTVLNQKFWPLSFQEWYTIGNTTVLAFPRAGYWLRSPLSSLVDSAWLGDPSGALPAYSVVYGGSLGVRPAFYLNLSSALFASDAGGAGMKSAAAGSPSLEVAEPSTGAIKLTMADDDSLALDTTTTLITASPSGGTRTFDYSGATTGTNKSVSMMICDQTTGDIMYYGRPVDLSSGSSSGTAAFTVPGGMALGEYTVKVFNEEVNDANYTDYASTPKEFTLRISVTTVDLSTNPDTTKVYTGAVDILAVVGNNTGQPGSTIEDLEWFRVPVSDITDYSSSFDSTCDVLTSADKGIIADPNTSELTETFQLAADKNATYWFKGTVMDGADSYITVECITVDNLYQRTPISVRGEIDGSSPTQYLYEYEVVSGTYGIPYDLDGTTVLFAPSLGFDTVTLNAGSQYTQNWIAAMKSGTALPLMFTMNSDFFSNTECDGGDISKYTIVYAKNRKWQNLTAHFVDSSGVSLTAVDGVTSEVFIAPLDNSGDVTAFKSNGGSYLPAAVTSYDVTGYKVGSTGTFVPLTDFSDFDPSIPVTSLSITDVYIVYQVNTVDLEITKTVTGAYADMGKDFTFTVYFEDFSETPFAAGTQLIYTGGIISNSGAVAPTGGTLTLDSDGKAGISLKHGQIITIEGVPVNGRIRIVETTDADYSASFKDSEDTGLTSGADTGIRTMTNADRTFDFTNVKTTVVPSGIAGDDNARMLLTVIVCLAIGAGVVIAMIHRRRRRIG